VGGQGGGAGPGEKRAGSVREAAKEGARSGIPEVVGSERIGKKKLSPHQLVLTQANKIQESKTYLCIASR